ncbi:AAA family ATPase [Tenacibaculum xiamenense]|uniref:AAA family ATPase n=1 Tax=Tenacibaculum xiamenense TaxID=1261553 RepID=UPI003892D10F
MNNNVLVLTGACGVGKSTIGKAWAKERKGVCIESDYFTEWIHDDHPISTEYFLNTEKLIADLSWACAETYLKNGFSVAIENVWSPKGFGFLRDKIQKNTLVNEFKFVHLKCDLEENFIRDNQRASDNQMKERVEIVKLELEDYTWQDYVHIIDSSSKSIEETLSIIASI